MLSRLLDRSLHPCIVDVSLCVDEEVILPVHLLAWTLLDIRQVHTVVSEYVQHFSERSGLVRRREHDRSFVVATSLCRFSTDDEEARDVVWVVFDVFE